MKLNFYFKSLKWCSSFLACFTMVFSPLAMGKEAEALSKSQLQQSLTTLGMDKKTTLGEVWENSKVYVPGHDFKSIEKLVNQNRNAEFPAITVDTSKSTDGTEVPVLNFTHSGKTFSIQIYGEKNKWAKINGVAVPASDFTRIENLFARLEASDAKVSREATVYRDNQEAKDSSAQYKNDFSRFNGFPRITPQMWKSFTKKQRAGYIVKMRMMWLSARKVLEAGSGFTDGAALQVPAHDKQSWLNLILPLAEATPPAAAARQAFANSCVVAGYVGSYEQVKKEDGTMHTICSIDKALSTYGEKPELAFVKKANEECVETRSTLVACNPIIYGSPGGVTLCVDRTSRSFQQATHFSSKLGPTCDSKSPLNGNDNVISFDQKDYSTAPSRAKQLEAIEKDQKEKDFLLTENYIDGIFKKKNDPAFLPMKELLANGKWTPEIDRELVRIQNQFENEINSAIATCEKEITGRHEDNQKLACDQLHRRWIFTEKYIAQFRAKGCLDGSQYIGAYGKDESLLADESKSKLNKSDVADQALCQCAAKPETNAEAKKIKLGETCTVAPPVVETPCALKCKADGVATDKCICPTTDPQPPVCSAVQTLNKEKTPPACECKEKCKEGEVQDTTSCTCTVKVTKPEEPKPETKPVEEKKKKSILPWIIGGAVAALALYLLFRKSGKTAPPPPVIPSCAKLCPVGSSLNRATCSCTQDPPVNVCPAPKVGTPPSCSCPAAPSFCTPPQKIYNMSTCQCSDIVLPITCADGSLAPNGNLSQCPKCADGSYKNINGCPTEGGNGNNCPQGNCSGGLPTTGTSK